MTARLPRWAGFWLLATGSLLATALLFSGCSDDEDVQDGDVGIAEPVAEGNEVADGVVPVATGASSSASTGRSSTASDGGSRGAASADGDDDDDDDGTNDWSLVGLYDGAALARMQDAAPGMGFSWQPALGVEEWCGHAKGPLGHGGAMDAELIGRARVPYLVAVVAGPADSVLTTEDLLVFVRDGAAPASKEASRRERYWLAPAVAPRRLEVAVSLDERSYDLADRPEKELARKMVRQLQSQLTVQLCLEHQVGRAWAGVGEVPNLPSDVDEMQNIFMLDAMEHDDRRLFVGQGMSAAPLLGPSVWKPRWRPVGSAPAQLTGRRLRTADLFGFRSPALLSAPSSGTSGFRQLEPIAGWPDDWLPLGVGGAHCPGCRWAPQATSGVTELELTVGVGAGEPPLWLTARHVVGRSRPAADKRAGAAPSAVPSDDLGADWIDWEGGERRPVGGKPDVTDLFGSGSSVRELPDVLAAVPYEFPRIAAVLKPSADKQEAPPPKQALTVLLVPNWQLVNAMRFVEMPWVNPLLPLDDEPVDGVGSILNRPELLHVQKRDRQEADVLGEDGQRSAPGVELVPKLNEKLPYRWGPSPDFRAASAPAVVAGVAEVTPDMQSAASQSGIGHMVVAAVLALFCILIVGFARLQNLWSARPRERAWGWPTRRKKSFKEKTEELEERAEKVEAKTS